MALFFADLVREASWGEGAGDLALGGPLPGHRAFASAVPTGARFHYAISGVTHPQEWETGEGEIADGKLARTPLASSAAGAAVNLSVGLKTVALTVNAGWFEARDGDAAIEDVVGLEDALAAKAALAHGHSFASLSGKPTTLAGYGIGDAAGAGHDHASAYQPLDAELSALGGLTTTGFGRAQLELADAAALRGHAGLGSIAVQAAGAVAITGGQISGIVDLAIADGGTGASSAPAARANLGLGSAAVKNVGTSGDAVPLLGGGAVSWAAGAAFGGAIAVNVPSLDFSGISGGLVVNGVAGGPGDGQAITFTSGNGAYRAARLYSYLSGVDLADLRIATGDGAGSYADRAIFNAAGLSLASGVLSIGAGQVAGARRTGWSLPTGTAARSGFDTASVTVEALAQRLKALIDDLAAHGLIGA